MTITPTVVSFDALKNGTVPAEDLIKAFAPQSLGILLVKDLPSSFPALRRRVLSNASHLANLDSGALTDLEAPDAKYLVGWSCGKEKFGDGSFVDTLKGSFYANCAFHKDESLESALGPDDLPEFTKPNIWPRESLPDFEKPFKELACVNCLFG